MTRRRGPSDPPLPPPFDRRGGALELEGLPLAALAAEHGTPLYVTSERRVRERARELRRAFEPRWPSYQLLYAMKANPNPAVVRVLASEGVGADCSSPAEIRIAREAGVPTDRTLYTGAYPTDAELVEALRGGVTINLDDPALLPRLERLGRPGSLSFRINPGRTASGPEGLRFAGRHAKFGAPLPSVLPAIRRAAAWGVPRLGLHTMPGSNVLDPGHFAWLGRFLGGAVRTVRERCGVALDFVDAGGGLGVPYRPGERPLDVERVAEALTDGLREGLGPDGSAPPPRLLQEPGRYLMADSTVLLTRVAHIKAGSPPWVGVDAGMHTLLRPALYDAYHPISPVVARPGPTRPVTVVGPVCENTDTLARGRPLPPLEVGDLLAVANAGAYGFSMSSQYNTRPRPGELLVSDGTAHRMRAPERFEDLVRRAELPPHLRPRVAPARAARRPRTAR